MEGNNEQNQSIKNFMNKQTLKEKTNEVVKFIKTQKVLLGLVVVALIVIAVLIDLVCVSPKEAVKKFVNALDAGKAQKAFKYVDFAGMYVLNDLDTDEYDEFWDEYKDFRGSDEYDDLQDTLDEIMDEDDFEDINDEFGDDISIKVSKISNIKKEDSHLYRVTAKLKIDDGDEEETETVRFYVMKKGTKSYIIGSDSYMIYSLF